MPLSVQPSEADMDARNQLMSMSTLSIIRHIYEDVNGKFQTNTNSDRIKNSVFGCCFEDGMAMFTFWITNSRVKLTGFFIPREYLRTAWKLFRKELVRLASVDFFNGQIAPFSLSAEDIYAYSERAQMNMSWLQSLVDEVEKSDVPFSFTNTGLPVSSLPVIFDKSKSSAVTIEENGNSGIIPLDKYENVALNMSAYIKSNYPVASNIYLCCDMRKSYYSQKREQIKKNYPKHKVKDSLQMLDAEVMSGNDKEIVWFFRFVEPDIEHLVLVDPNAFNAKLTADNTIDLDVVIFNMRAAIRRVKQIKESFEVPIDTDKDKKKGGFGGIFKRK